MWSLFVVHDATVRHGKRRLALGYGRQEAGSVGGMTERLARVPK